MAVALHLRAPVCTPHPCRCGRRMDQFGHHNLSCCFSAGRLPCHANLNDVVKRGLASAGILSVLELVGLDRGDCQRPDGFTVFHFRRVNPWRGISRASTPTQPLLHSLTLRPHQEPQLVSPKTESATVTPTSLNGTLSCPSMSRRRAYCVSLRVLCLQRARAKNFGLLTPQATHAKLPDCSSGCRLLSSAMTP